MYYKITDKSSKVYQELHALRTKELAMDKSNEEKIVQHFGTDFKSFLGEAGQQHIYRTRRYVGFVFEDTDVLDPKAWRKHPNYPTVLVPNKRTAAGRAAARFINELEQSNFITVFDILNVEPGQRFQFPYVAIVDDTVLLSFGEYHNLPPEVEEITSVEFEKLLGINMSVGAEV